MRYGKIENNRLVYYPNPVTADGQKIYNPTVEMLSERGYKRIVNRDYPSDGKHYKQEFIETETEIIITWADNEAEYWRTTSYDEAVDTEIRKRYSASAEFAILRQRDEKPEEYAAYYAYCEECKEYCKQMREKYEVRE